MSYPYSTQTVRIASATTAAYSANQVIGNGVQVFPLTPYGGFVQTVQLNINSTNANQIDLCMFTSSMPNTTFTDHSSIAVSSADFSAMGIIANVTNWNYMGLNATAGIASGLAYAVPTINQIPLYWCLVARGAVTLGSTNGVSVTVTFVS